MSIQYDSSINAHSEHGAYQAMVHILGELEADSILDVGCGPMMWGKAALRAGVRQYMGVDGMIPESNFPTGMEISFLQHDLTLPLSLDQRFDLVLCLEVAEHLPEDAGRVLVASLTAHADRVLFSAAAPGQGGQNHINCQWPDYWQQLFNRQGFSCRDDLRWKLWDVSSIEPWYRQNMFLAERTPIAGKEERIRNVIHPDMLGHVTPPDSRLPAGVLESAQRMIYHGAMPVTWYPRAWIHALGCKLKRRFLKRGKST